MDSLMSCPGGDLALPNLNVDKLSLNTRFLIISLPNSEMTKVSPFAIQKALIEIGGKPKSVKRLRSGDLLVETNSALQTKSFLLAKIRPYIPNPLRCFKCQRFGHSQTSCRGQLTCSRCASVEHASTDCSLEPKLVNCLQAHPSDSKICPKWKIEKQIQEIKTTKNISYPEARKLIVPQLSQTYAQAAKSSTLINSTQTDENITKIKCPPLKLLAPLSSKQRPNIPTAVTTSSSAQTQLLPSISSKTSTSSDPQPPTAMSKTKGKIKELPSPLHRPRKDNIKIDLMRIKPTSNLKKNPEKNTSVKIAREQDSSNETSPVSKKSRRRKTFKTSDVMDTNANSSDTDYVTGLASEEDESFLEADFKKMAAYFHEPTRSYHTLDLAICSPSLFTHLNLSVEKDRYNSDHFPVILSHDSDTGGKTFPPTYSYCRADWALFTQLAVIPDAMVKTESVDTAVQEVTNVLIAAADLSIPKVSSHSFQRYKPWWNTDCQTAYKNQRKL
ncbi:RNA-directed DNA polymerase from mobile element jockey [Trichonephila clavipes]|nr:RNA-directed DNA polymerase from mobile element jockey [Trichonephila clavipes]